MASHILTCVRSEPLIVFQLCSLLDENLLKHRLCRSGAIGLPRSLTCLSHRWSDLGNVLDACWTSSAVVALIADDFMLGLLKACGHCWMVQVSDTYYWLEEINTRSSIEGLVISVDSGGMLSE
ncbi:hypothetical protein E1B28_011105 [Marasmius oreades]|uniref:Uncharacterized protein n=1 Tax=Marasmius oreades TaxID=181124 RepID=A0A9P7UP72_9AGAR|nr:uncharacterized protein E1B28_011105 [Marasmius oreades]KAG7089417.1 hypothetical protein E1B28_011105 [Marasmius oreades]